MDDPSEGCRYRLGRIRRSTHIRRLCSQRARHRARGLPGRQLHELRFISMGGDCSHANPLLRRVSALCTSDVHQPWLEHRGLHSGVRRDAVLRDALSLQEIRKTD